MVGQGGHLRAQVVKLIHDSYVGGQHSEYLQKAEDKLPLVWDEGYG
jgi:hypothetical protein